MKKNPGLWLIIALVAVAVALIFLSKYITTAPASQDALATLAPVADDHMRGAVNGQLVLIEYLDFQCPSCGGYYPIVKAMEAEFGDRVTFITRHFPLPMHPNALPAAEAAEAAGNQGKFWEMHDLLFERQKVWSAPGQDTKALFEGYATELGLDLDRFRADAASSATLERIKRDQDQGMALKINGTPTFFLNGKKLENPGTIEAFRATLAAALAAGQ